jgi:VIT1/CCC1 family predicted Fe2+/Mn2+ transporter
LKSGYNFHVAAQFCGVSGDNCQTSPPENHLMKKKHNERHRIETIGWLRAAVLGANDGIVSTASLVLGVASAHVAHGSILLTGVAGLVSGGMSMATGEYISVSSQADTEKAALEEERISKTNAARPLQAAFASACSFTAGAALPLIVAALSPETLLIPLVAVAALASLAFLGGLAAKTAGTKIWTGIARVTFWSASAMAAAAGVGMFFSTAM